MPVGATLITHGESVLSPENKNFLVKFILYKFFLCEMDLTNKSFKYDKWKWDSFKNRMESKMNQ